MVIFISLWRWRKTPNFRLCCKATEKLVDSQEKVVQHTYDYWRLVGNLLKITNKQKEKTMTFEEILKNYNFICSLMFLHSGFKPFMANIHTLVYL